MRSPLFSRSKIDASPSRLFRNIGQRSVFERLAVLGLEEGGLGFGEEVVVAFAHQIFARDAQERLARSIESDEAKVLGILDEDHVRNVLDDGVEESIGLSGLGDRFSQRLRGALRPILTVAPPGHPRLQNVHASRTRNVASVTHRAIAKPPRMLCGRIL